jgi:hypothetical protein
VKNSRGKVLEKNVEKSHVEKTWINDLEEVKGRGQKSLNPYIQNLSQNSSLLDGPKILKALRPDTFPKISASGMGQKSQKPYIHNLSQNSSLEGGFEIAKALYPQPFPK